MNDPSRLTITVEQHEKVVSQSVSNHDSDDCGINRSYFYPHNSLKKDGRIYGGYDVNGNYFSASVSPYFEGFQSQIEAGVYPLVEAFRQKGYLTCSSCYGHPKRLSVIFCFPSEEARAELRAALAALSIPTMHLLDRVTVSNTLVAARDDGSFVYKKTESYDDSLALNLKFEADNFNQQFFRSYDRYYFLEMRLFGDYRWYIAPWRYLMTAICISQKDKIIIDFAKKIEQQDFPSFLY